MVPGILSCNAGFGTFHGLAKQQSAEEVDANLLTVELAASVIRRSATFYVPKVATHGDYVCHSCERFLAKKGVVAFGESAHR